MVIDYTSPQWSGLRVESSEIAGAGDGLFAQRYFSAGEIICDYRGRVLSLAEALRLKDTTYLMGLSLKVHLDASEAFEIPGRYVNDNFDASKINAKFKKFPQLWKAQLVAIRAINPGDEIYAAYGESYWRARRRSSPTNM